MSQTNSWSSKEWFKASKEHFNNVKSSLPTANTQTGINVVVSGAFATAYSYETPVLKIPGQLGAAPVQAVVGAGKSVADKVGERTAAEGSSFTTKELVVSNTNSEDTPVRVKELVVSNTNSEDTPVRVVYGEDNDIYQIEQEQDLQGLNNRAKKPESASELENKLTEDQLKTDESVSTTHYTHTTVSPKIQNNQTKDWETAGKWAEKASGAAVTAGAGIGCYAFSKGITTAGNSLLEGKSVLESFGNGVHAAKATVENAAYGAIEAGAAAVDLGVGSAILCVEAAGWVGGKIWDYTAGQLPHDEQSSIEIAGEAVVDATN